jgi:hypothetical protein
MPTPRLDAERHRPLWISLFLIALDLTTMSRAWGNDMVPEEVASGTMWLYVGTYTHGKTPSEGIYLVAENQDSDSIVVFRIDPATGGLEQVGEPLGIPMPVCIRMIPKPGGGD